MSFLNKEIQHLQFRVATLKQFNGNIGLLKVIVLIKENKLDGLLKCM